MKKEKKKKERVIYSKLKKKSQNYEYFKLLGYRKNCNEKKSELKEQILIYQILLFIFSLIA